MQFPLVMIVNLNPEIVQILLVLEVIVTGSPLLAVAVKVYGDWVICNGDDVEKEIV